MMTQLRKWLIGGALAAALVASFAYADVVLLPHPVVTPEAPAVASGGYKLPVPTIETLPNGLRVVWFRNDALPVIDMIMVVRSGSRDDPKGKSGTAELTSSLLDRGAGGMSANDLAHAVEMLGATRYSSVDEDMFTLGMHGLAPDGLTLLDLFAKMTLHPDFPAAEVTKTHARTLERWSHVADYGETLATVAYHRLLAAGTIYGRGTFLSAQEFGGVTREDVMAFHHKHFTPANSVLMIVGRVNPDTFGQRIAQLFGNWTGGEPARETVPYADRRVVLPSRLQPHGKSGTGKEIVVVDRPSLTQAQVRIGFRAPSIHAKNHYALAVVNALLGEYFNSRLNALIRDKLGLTYAISSSFSYMKDFSTFTVASATRTEAIGQLVSKVVDVLKDLKAGPISTEEITTAKEFLVGGFPLSTSTLSAVAARWLSGYVFDLGPTYLNEFVPRISAVTVSDAVAAVGKDFDVDDLTVVIAGDAKVIVPALSKLKGFKIRKLGPESLL